jgi:hypothetical protein
LELIAGCRSRRQCKTSSGFAFLPASALAKLLASKLPNSTPSSAFGLFQQAGQRTKHSHSVPLTHEAFALAEAHFGRREAAELWCRKDHPPTRSPVSESLNGPHTICDEPRH